jgi:hypothetical protein
MLSVTTPTAHGDPGEDFAIAHPPRTRTTTAKVNGRRTAIKRPFLSV